MEDEFALIDGSNIEAPATFRSNIQAVKKAPSTLTLTPGAINEDRTGLLVNGAFTGEGDRANNGYAYVNVAESVKNDAPGKTIDGLTVNIATVAGAGAGNRTGAMFVLSTNTPVPKMTGTGQDYRTAVFAKCYQLANEAGATALSPQGNYFGWGSIAQIGSPSVTGCHAKSVVGGEFDVIVNAGNTAQDKIVLQLAAVNDDAVKGSRSDAMLCLLNGAATTAKFDFGIVFGREGAKFPIDGTLIGAYPSIDALACGRGVDLANVTFSEFAFRSNGFTINPAGLATSGFGFSAPQVRMSYANLPVDAGGLHRFSGSNTGLRLQRNTAPAGDFSSASTVLNVSVTGNIGISVTDPSATLDVGGNTIRVRGTRSPASSSAPGNTGDVCWDASFIYVCVATNVWRRSPLASW